MSSAGLKVSLRSKIVTLTLGLDNVSERCAFALQARQKIDIVSNDIVRMKITGNSRLYATAGTERY